MIAPIAIRNLTIAYLAFVAVGAILAYCLVAPDYASKLPSINIDDAAVKALDLSNELTKQLITLATALIGGCIWIITRPLTNNGEIFERLIWCLLALLLFSASMYFGFVEIDASLASLSAGGFNPLIDLVWWPQTLQYYSFVAGAVVLGLACLRSINAIVEKK